MLQSVNVVIIMGLFWTNQLVWADCVVSTETKTRSFDTIAEYQGNKISFNQSNGNWIGSNVEFSFKTIDKLEKNSFITKGSEFVRSLKLSSKQIKIVDEGAFISLTCLNELLLDHNNITKLTQNVFQSLGALEKLNLSYNKLEILKDLTFSNLPKLKTLDLSNNHIKSIEILAFTNLTFLECLNLEVNQVSKVYDELFYPLPNLRTLILSCNKLWNIQPQQWRGLDKLQSLELARNNLQSFDPSYNFSFSALKSLNLSSNSLTILNVIEVRRHLPQLELLDLNNNHWFCDDLENIVHQFHDSKIKLLSSNFSNVGVNGIACSKVKGEYSSTTTEIFVSTTAKPQIWVDKDELERYVEKKIADNNEETNSSIQSLRTFVICMFCLLCIFIILQLAYRTNICESLTKKLRRDNNVFMDDSTNLENFRLLQ